MGQAVDTMIELPLRRTLVH